MKKWAVWLCSLLLLLPLAACGNDADQKEKTLTKVRLAEVTRSIFYAPQYVALAKGFFEEEGLDVELTTTWGGDKTMTTLLSGGADIALVGSETSIYVYAQGTNDPVINFAQLTQTDGTFLVSRKKIDNFTWEMLKGSTFLGQRKGGMPQMVGEFVLKQHGIDPHQDLKLIQNVDFANIANAFASGTGDFVQLFEPTASIFEQEGKGYIIASFGTESGRVPYTTYMAKQSYMNKNKDIIEKFTRAIYKAQQWVESHSTKEIAKVIQPYFEDTELDIIETVVDRYKSQGSYATDPILDEEEWNNLQNIMDEAGELPKRIDLDTLVDSSFAKKVMND
ncbi:ABC transporter substrate-binding protein [Geobacillus thermodenitrificans]|jgi:NitT/TauT family transport system substrate-binding protein|uniref:ABC transporter substrate-binding protein n=1 Tax=Geobacillus thermodenitrificans (strain NG80-2) TaxID=420246 RepID=A4IRZ5_GEOTN|nr:ABC transporter substrate-binding protein [Geobacillus thermodenitrificans]ABO68099.1 ABC transporter substrate-binding protein [Geobacillus thermodenitrificans NG80-2]MED3716981.1 ABC transporter substrate-binding protein [Geobacillus thermodenitrificans]